jgi:DNA polymerase III delta prime subunit
MLSHTDGILLAPPGSGKTVIALPLSRKVFGGNENQSLIPLDANGTDLGSSLQLPRFLQDVS